ncbi:MAG: hypothetical protein P8R54_25755 [Myxococcota bacterium]|nr:hypothetical protein [Myxococcota bacterium]
MFTSALMLLSMGCSSSIIQAPYGSAIVVPNSIEINWSEDYNDYDLAGVVQLFDVQVLDPEGLPMENVQVEISTSYGGVYIVPQESIELVGYPSVPEGINSQADVREYCSDDQGNYTLVEDWCAWYWDSVTDQYYSFAGTYADNFTSLDSGDLYWYAPTYVDASTNSRGLYRGYLLIDTLPDLGAGSYADVVITVSIGVDVQTFSISVVT